jgi:hypothetical protein
VRLGCLGSSWLSDGRLARQRSEIAKQRVLSVNSKRAGESPFPESNFQPAIEIEGCARGLEGGGTYGNTVIICAVGRAKGLGNKMVIVIEGSCAQLSAGGVVLIEKIIHLHKSLNPVGDLVTCSEIGNPVPRRFARSVVEHTIGLVEVIFVTPRK